MKPGFIVLIVIGAAATIAGSILLGIGLANGIPSRGKEVTNEYVLNESFTSFNLQLSTADLEFKPSEDGVNKVVVKERENYHHEVKVEEGSLNIKYVDNSKWYDFLRMGTGELKVTLYVNPIDYLDLNVKASTGDIVIPSDYHFLNLNVTLSTGNINLACSASNSYKVEASTGNISLSNLSSKELDVKASTGNVDIKDVVVVNNVNVKTSTGHIALSNLKATNLTTTCSTGKTTLTNVTLANQLNMKASTGKINIYDSDAEEVNIVSTTGDVNASFLTSKIVYTKTDTGDVDVPRSKEGGICSIETDTGDITVKF